MVTGRGSAKMGFLAMLSLPDHWKMPPSVSRMKTSPEFIASRASFTSLIRMFSARPLTLNSRVGRTSSVTSLKPDAAVQR